MQKQLDTPYDVEVTITHQEVTTFSFDLASQTIYIGYSILTDTETIYQPDRPIVLTEPDYTDFKARLNVLNGTLPASQALLTTALEYCPGSGVISEVSPGRYLKQLNNPYNIDGTIRGQEVDSFSFNVAEDIIGIGYSRLETPSVVNMSDQPYVLSDIDYHDYLARFNSLGETIDADIALVQTSLEFLPGSGTIV